MGNKRVCNEKDLYIAQKLRERRIELEINQSDVADKLGVTSQQIHKYEKGIDRIPAGRLDDFAEILSVPISFFFKNNEGKTPSLKEKVLGINRAYLKGEKVRLKSFKLKAILTDTKTQEEYDLEIS